MKKKPEFVVGQVLFGLNPINEPEIICSESGLKRTLSDILHGIICRHETYDEEIIRAVCRTMLPCLSRSWISCDDLLSGVGYVQYEE